MKKIILSFLILALLITNVGFVALADTETENVGEVLSYWDGTSAYPTDSSIIKKNGSGADIRFLIPSGTSGGFTSVKEIEEAYYKVETPDFRSNYRTGVSSHLNGDNPVLSFSYDIRIPEEVSTGIRYTEFLLTSSGTSNQTKVVVSYDGKFFVSSTVSVNEVDSKTASYKSGEWATVEMRAYLEDDDKIRVGVYVDGNQIYYGTGTRDYTNGFELRQIDFCTVGGTVAYETHLDDIKISTLPVAYKPTVGYLSYWDGTLIGSNGKVQADDSVLSGGGNFYPVNGSSVKKALVARSNANGGYGTGVTHIKDGDNNSYYSVNWSDVQNNFQTDLTALDLIETSPVVSVSYDICIPSDSSNKTRRTQLRFANDANGNRPSIVYINYSNGGFTVDNGTYFNAVTSKTKAYTPGEWATVEMRAYLEDDDKIRVGVYVDDEQIFYGTGKSTYDSSWYLYTVNFITEKESDNTTYTTYLDDINISLKADEFKPDSMIKITLEQSGDIVESKAEVSSIYSNLCFVTAVYNSNNALEKLWIDTTIENGILTNTVSGADYVKKGYKVKAFVLDSLQSAIPQVESASLTID